MQVSKTKAVKAHHRTSLVQTTGPERSYGMPKAFWDKKNPKKKSKKLTPAQISWAKSYSKSKGWKYPNLIANSMASRKA